jgi:3-deoxy-D-manno-octulosonic-acid transferase
VSDHLAEDVKSLKRFAFGNGEPGADERLRNLEAGRVEMASTLKRVETKVNALAEDRDATRNQWKGAKATVIAVGTLIGVATTGGSLWVVTALNRVMQALP